MADKGHLEFTVGSDHGGNGLYVTQTKHHETRSFVGADDEIVTAPVKTAEPDADVLFQKMVTSAEALDRRGLKAKEKGLVVDLTQNNDTGDGDDEATATAGPAVVAVVSKRQKRANAELKISAR